MIDQTFREIHSRPEYLILLSAYRERDLRLRESNSEFDGWQTRIPRVEGIEAEVMSRIHGRLISHGLLQFHLGDRLDGMKYQLSSDAVRMLDRQPLEEHVEDDAEAA